MSGTKVRRICVCGRTVSCEQWPVLHWTFKTTYEYNIECPCGISVKGAPWANVAWKMWAKMQKIAGSKT